MKTIEKPPSTRRIPKYGNLNNSQNRRSGVNSAADQASQLSGTQFLCSGNGEGEVGERRDTSGMGQESVASDPSDASRWDPRMKGENAGVYGEMREDRGGRSARGAEVSIDSDSAS